jgi:hypothetical protein
MLPLTRTALLVALAACATVSGARGDLEALKPALENFHKRLRWQDFHGAAELLVPERRDAFVAQSDQRNDFELLEVDVEPEGKRATGVSKISWFRLPDANQQTKTVRTVMLWNGATWLIESQSAGPFAADLPKVDRRDAGLSPTTPSGEKNAR